jgi:3-oxoacyl-[acyl-carrier protein] reductase
VHLAGKKTAIVTGSTRGIGKAIAFRLLQEGYNVVLNYADDEEQAQKTLFQIDEQERSRVLLFKADVAKKDAIHHLVTQTLSMFHTIDVLINNAARVVDKPVMQLTEDDWDTVVDTTLKGAFLCSQTVAPFMLDCPDGGVIINIGASTGLRGRKNGVNTCAAKAGIMMLTQCLALELGPKVRVNTLIPGLTQTEETVARFHLNDPEIVRERTEAIPLQRIGTPEDIANAVMLLLSNEASFINGQKLVVDGGQYMW